MDTNSLERLITLSANTETLVRQVNIMDKKLDEMRTDHATVTATAIAVMQSKINRLEAILYGTAALCVTEGLALLVNYISK